MFSVGAPIRVEKCENPSKQQIDNLHAKYIDHLINLFDDNKTKYGVPKNARITVSWILIYFSSFFRLFLFF